MNLIDTHAHIFLDEFKEDLDQVVRQSREAGVFKILMPNIDSKTLEPMMAVAEKYKGFCLPMIGLHPTSVDANYEKEISRLESALTAYRFYGVGESGTDLYRDKSFFAEQKASLQWHIDLSKRLMLPLVLHSRDSMDETIRMIEENSGPDLKGIFHCFSGTLSQASRIIGMGFLLGIGGVVTFKNSNLAEVLREIDISNLVLETDSPYLAPAPFRGKRNDPSRLDGIVRKLAEIKHIEPEEAAYLTTQNAMKLFRLEI